jgi:hypothetical protein
MKRKEDYTEEDEKALRDLDAASNNLKRVAGGKVGDSAEKAYGQAYKRCYQLGLKQYPPVVGATTR